MLPLGGRGNYRLLLLLLPVDVRGDILENGWEAAHRDKQAGDEQGLCTEGKCYRKERTNLVEYLKARRSHEALTDGFGGIFAVTLGGASVYGQSTELVKRRERRRRSSRGGE